MRRLILTLSALILAACAAGTPSPASTGAPSATPAASTAPLATFDREQHRSGIVVREP